MLIRTYQPDIGVNKEGNWADNYYVFAKKMNYPVAGNEDIGLRGKAISRLQVAELIAATQGVHYEENDAIRYLYGSKLAGGTDASKLTIESYNGEGTLTRAEAVQFLKNLFDKGKGELLARPQEYSDVSKLPEIPLEDDGEKVGKLDLKQYPTPDGWLPPVIKSVATDDYVEDRKILKNELGLLEGYYFVPYEGASYEYSTLMVRGSSGDYEYEIDIKAWYGSRVSVTKSNKTPYVAREIFKFFFPKEYGKLINIIEDRVNGKDVSKYINKPMLLDGRKVKIVEYPNSMSIFLSKKK
jgi:hypothetical protein